MKKMAVLGFLVALINTASLANDQGDYYKLWSCKDKLSGTKYQLYFDGLGEKAIVKINSKKVFADIVSFAEAYYDLKFYDYTLKREVYLLMDSNAQAHFYELRGAENNGAGELISDQLQCKAHF